MRTPPTAGLRPGRWSLRTRVLALTLAVLAAAGLAVGLVSVLALELFLTERLDTQLTAAVDRSSRAFDPPGTDGGQSPSGRGGPGGLFAPGQAEGTLGADLSGGEVVSAAVLSSAGTSGALPASATAVLESVPTDGTVHTVDLPGYGGYRVIAEPTAPAAASSPGSRWRRCSRPSPG